MAKVVLGIFSDQENAETAINELEEKGYNPKDMSIIMKDRQVAAEVSDNTGAGIVEGAAEGATTGAILGGLAGLIAATVIPGLGAFFIGGPIAAALGLGGAAASTASGAVTGAAAGGLLGALTGSFDMSDDDAKVYETRINEGGILVAVPSHDEEGAEVRAILDANGADNVRTVTSK